MLHLLKLDSVLDENQIESIKQQVTYSIMINLGSLKNHKFKFKPKDIIPNLIEINKWIAKTIIPKINPFLAIDLSLFRNVIYISNPPIIENSKGKEYQTYLGNFNRSSLLVLVFNYIVIQKLIWASHFSMRVIDK